MARTLIRGGSVVDGSGSPARIADLLIEDGLVADIGRIDAVGAEVVDADGLVVTPGWVDIHTHYDAQVFWDPLVTPSSWNGVTSVVTGSCGVGFAPLRPGTSEELVGLMTKIEAIPSETLREGVPWTWETFGEYLDCLDRTPRAIDVGTLVPHGPVRTYVMGARAYEGTATSEDVDQMVRIVDDALGAGAVGFSMSRTTEREAVPGTFAAPEEYMTLARVAGARGRVLQINAAAVNHGDNEWTTVEHEVALMRDISRAGQCPLSFSLIQLRDDAELCWRVLEMADAANHAGAQLVGQVLGRPLTMFMSLEFRHPFSAVPAFVDVAAGASGRDLVARLSQPEIRARVLADAASVIERPVRFDYLYPSTDPVDYAPAPEASIGAIARRERRSPLEVCYDKLLEDDGRALLLEFFANFADRTPATAVAQLRHPMTIPGIGDGGAHCTLLCDATTPTTVMTQWVRDGTGDLHMPLEAAVHELTLNTARRFGLHDRGWLTPGRRADINLIDLDELRLHRHEVIDDLPAGGRRIVQRASGYVATYVAGDRILENGVDTGARPGHTIRAGSA